MLKKSNDQPLKEVLKAFANSKKMKSKLTQLKVKDAWASMMGPTITKYTGELSLHKQTLYITITSASLRQELTYGKDKITKMLNEELGEEYIKEVVLK